MSWPDAFLTAVGIACFTLFICTLAWLGENTRRREHASALVVSQQQHERAQRGVLN